MIANLYFVCCVRFDQLEAQRALLDSRRVETQSEISSNQWVGPCAWIDKGKPNVVHVVRKNRGWHNHGLRAVSQASRPWCGLNQMQSWSTKLTMAIGTCNKSAGGAVTWSNAPSGGGRPMELNRFLRFAVSLAASVGKLHQRGLIHKDIKPANILVNSATAAVWLTGFGIATRLSRRTPVPRSSCGNCRNICLDGARTDRADESVYRFSE